MSKNDILIKLRNLHEELASINHDIKKEQIDEATIDALGQLITDAGTIVDQHREQSCLDELNQDSAGLNKQDLLARVQQLESEHPLVGQFLSQVTDLLGMMGI